MRQSIFIETVMDTVHINNNIARRWQIHIKLTSFIPKAKIKVFFVTLNLLIFCKMLVIQIFTFKPYKKEWPL